MVERTWETRELVILRAVFDALEEGGKASAVSAAARKAVPDLPAPVYMETIASLDEAGFLDATVMRGGGRIQAVHVNRLAERGRVAIGQWPGGDLSDQLLALLRQRLEAEKDPEKRSRIERLLGAIGDVGKDVLTSVLSALATGTLTGKP